MADEELNDDSSHYQITMTAGQAFIAFVFLLLSLAASFAFGVIIGRGQGEDRLVVQREAPVVTESSAPARGDTRIRELGVPDTASTETVQMAEAQPEAPSPPSTPPAENSATASAPPQREPAAPPETGESEPFFAQLLSSSDQKIAEALAARLINDGFTTAYVERSQGAENTVYRVRVKFPSEAAARAAVDRLQPYAAGEIWITKIGR